MRKFSFSLVAIAALVMGLVVSSTILDIPPARPALAASASCDIGTLEATIVCDSSAQIATITTAQQGKGGYLVNGGSNSVWINFTGGAIAATNAQNTTGEIEVPALATVPVRKGCFAFSYKAASSTSLLYWFPGE